jgi:hypothetical protein
MGKIIYRLLLKNKMRIQLLIIILLFASFSVMATDRSSNYHWQGRLEIATYNTIDWGVEAGIDYYPIKYIGLGVGISGADDFLSTGKSFFRDGMVWETNDLNNAIWFRTGVQLVSPAIWKSKDSSMSISVKEELGITMPVPTNKNVECTAVPHMSGIYANPSVIYFKNEGAKSTFFHSKTSVAFNVERWQAWVGYSWSNMDVYSSSRNVSIAGSPLDLPNKRNLSGIIIGVGYSF